MYLCGGYQGGIYHGRIILPAEYPFKPPSFVMLTPSGRFEVGKKICLSISERHPEHWQPSWSMRTALIALVAFLPSKGKGAIGSLVRYCGAKFALLIFRVDMCLICGHLRYLKFYEILQGIYRFFLLA